MHRINSDLFRCFDGKTLKQFTQASPNLIRHNLFFVRSATTGKTINITPKTSVYRKMLVGNFEHVSELRLETHFSHKTAGVTPP